MLLRTKRNNIFCHTFYKQPNVDEIERTGMIFVRRGWDSSVTNIEATYEPRMAICK